LALQVTVKGATQPQREGGVIIGGGMAGTVRRQRRTVGVGQVAPVVRCHQVGGTARHVAASRVGDIAVRNLFVGTAGVVKRDVKPDVEDRAGIQVAQQDTTRYI